MSDLSGLGRRYSPDSRDRNFLMSAPVARRAFRNWLMPGGVSDQGAMPHCVAHAAVHWLRSHRVVNVPIDQVTHYNACKLIDPWPGEDGTSVRVSFGLLKEAGYIDTYRWAFSVQPVIDHVMEIGPVVLGTVWTNGMFTPDRNGFIHPDGPEVGGHAYMVSGASEKRQALRITNSWGTGWGDKGRAWISYVEADGIIRAQGEACTAVEYDR